MGDDMRHSSEAKLNLRCQGLHATRAVRFKQALQTQTALLLNHYTPSAGLWLDCNPMDPSGTWPRTPAAENTN